MGFFKKLFASRKFWITIGAAVSAAVTGHLEWIPAILMGEVGAITIEDAARKIGIKTPPPEEA